MRLSRFVEGVTKDMPRSMMYKAFRNKRIKVNGKRAEPDTRLKTGDLIEMYINDEFFPPEGVKPTSEVTWANKTLVAEEIAVIVPVHENVIDDATVAILDEVATLAGSAIGKKLDQAIIFDEGRMDDHAFPRLTQGFQDQLLVTLTAKNQVGGTERGFHARGVRFVGTAARHRRFHRGGLHTTGLSGCLRSRVLDG